MWRKCVLLEFAVVFRLLDLPSWAPRDCPRKEWRKVGSRIRTRDFVPYDVKDRQSKGVEVDASHQTSGPSAYNANIVEFPRLLSVGNRGTRWRILVGSCHRFLDALENARVKGEREKRTRILRPFSVK